MALMSVNVKSSSRYLGDSSHLTSWTLDSGAMCHMKPHVSDFIPGSLEDMDKYIKVSDGNHVRSKQKGQAQIRCATVTEILLSRHCTT